MKYEVFACIYTNPETNVQKLLIYHKDNYYSDQIDWNSFGKEWNETFKELKPYIKFLFIKNFEYKHEYQFISDIFHDCKEYIKNYSKQNTYLLELYYSTKIFSVDYFETKYVIQKVKSYDIINELPHINDNDLFFNTENKTYLCNSISLIKSCEL